MRESLLGKIDSVKFGINDRGNIDLAVTLNFSTGEAVGVNWLTYKDIPTDLEEGLLLILNDAKRRDVAQLKGIPILAHFTDQLCNEWRILTEVL